MTLNKISSDTLRCEKEDARFIRHFIRLNKMGQESFRWPTQTLAYKQREKQSRENRKYNYPCLFDPQGIHSIMPLDLIHLQKSWAGCKAWFTVDSDHEKASFPPTFHTDKELPHLHSMWDSQLWICMWDRGTLVKKQTLTMNEYIRLLYTDCPFIQTLWKRTGQHTVVTTGYSPNIRGTPGSASINVFFLKTTTQWTVNWALS